MKEISILLLNKTLGWFKMGISTVDLGQRGARHDVPDLLQLQTCIAICPKKGELFKEKFYAALPCLRPWFIPAPNRCELFLTTNRCPPVHRFWRVLVSRHAVVESHSARIRWRFWRQRSQLGVTRFRFQLRQWPQFSAAQLS